MKNKIKFFFTNIICLYITLIVIILLYSIADFYIVKVSELKYAHIKLNAVTNSIIEHLQDDLLKIITFLDVCNNTQCSNLYKPALDILPEFILLKNRSKDKNTFKITLFKDGNIEFISIKQGDYNAIIKTEAIKNKLSSVLPNSISYTLYNRDKVFIKNAENNQESNKELSRSFKLINNDLIMNYWVNEKFINSKLTTLLENIVAKFIMFSIAITIISIILYKYIKNIVFTNLTNTLKEIDNNKINLEKKYFNLHERVSLLKNERNIDRKLTQMFCQYLYFKKSSIVENDKILRELELKEKIVIKDRQSSTINIKELIQLIEIYYADYIKHNNIDFLIEANVDSLQLEIIKESFYQLVFSIIDNKLRLLENGDKLKISIIKSENELKLLIEDSGFLLSDEQIREYSNNFKEQRNIFFLCWDEIITTFKYYGYYCETKTIGRNNHIEIKFLCNSNYDSENKICYLEHYRK